MESIATECTQLKHDYEKCFNEWFSEQFLRGNTKEPTGCEDLFKKYRDCIKPKLGEELKLAD